MARIVSIIEDEEKELNRDKQFSTTSLFSKAYSYMLPLYRPIVPNVILKILN